MVSAMSEPATSRSPGGSRDAYLKLPAGESAWATMERVSAGSIK